MVLLNSCILLSLFQCLRRCLLYNICLQRVVEALVHVRMKCSMDETIFPALLSMIFGWIWCSCLSICSWG